MTAASGTAVVKAGLQIVVLAKAPVPGRVKTRLSPTYSPEAAAELAHAALLDTLDAVGAAPVGRRFLVLDGTLAAAFPTSIEVLRQRGEGLAERIDCALGDVFAISAQPTLLIGMDTPQVSAADLSSAGDRLAAPGADAVLGLAEDGGFWALGLRRWIPGLFSGVEMSRSDTGEQQLRRLREARLRIALLPSMRDVDTAQDASAVAAVAPSGRFAQTLFRLNRYAEASAP
jgi:hypothetical protein